MSQWRKLYNSKRWKRRRLDQLQTEPLCRMHKSQGHSVLATVADHVIPHRGNETLFYEGQLQSLCKTCHDRHKKKQEMTGIVLGGDVHGNPIDPNHHWWNT